MRTKSRTFCLLFWGLTCLATKVSHAQDPLGPEFRLNRQGGVVVFDLDVINGLDGVFTTAWAQAPDPNEGPQRAVARRFQAGHVSDELTLLRGAIPDHVIELPRLAPAPNGGWTFFYTQSRPDGYAQLFGSRFSRQGIALDSRFQVSTPSKSSAQVHAVARLPSSGTFVLAEDNLCPGCEFPRHHLFARILDPQGLPITPYFVVNPDESRIGFCGTRSAGADASGNTVVVWAAVSRTPTRQTSLLAQRFSATGERLGSTFLITKPSPATVLVPSVAVNPGGDFLIVWQYQPDPNTPRSLRARHFSKSGKPMGQEFVVEADVVADSIVPDIASDSRGNYVVVWTSYPNFYCTQVRGRLFRADDTPVGPSFLLSSGGDTCDQFPKVAFGPNGTFAAAWIRTLDNGGSDIYAAMFRVNP